VPNLNSKKFVMVDNEVMDTLLPKVGHLAFSVYMVMKRYANKDTDMCFPSIDTISEMCRCSRASVVKAVKTLEMNKVIKVQRSRKKPNVYTLNVPTLWGTDRMCLEGIIMNCPECDVPTVRNKDSYVCPKCLMDVGKYVEETLSFHFPSVRKRDIYSSKEPKNYYLDGYPPAYYENLLGKEEPMPIPDYTTHDVIIDFS